MTARTHTADQGPELGGRISQHQHIVNTEYRSLASEVSWGEGVSAAQEGYRLGPRDVPLIGMALLVFVYLLLV